MTDLARQPMRWQQVLAIALCVALNALDGFDVLSLSFASPGIAHEWAVDRAALGFVLSFELMGMAAGSSVQQRMGSPAKVFRTTAPLRNVPWSPELFHAY